MDNESSSTITVPKLQGHDDYLQWARKVQDAIGAKNARLWMVIDGSYDSIAGDDSEKTQNPRVLRMQAASLLKVACGENAYLKIEDLTDPKDIWDRLKELYGKAHIMSIAALSKELSTLTQVGSIEDFVGDLDRLTLQFKKAGSTLDADRKLQTLLGGIEPTSLPYIGQLQTQWTAIVNTKSDDDDEATRRKREQDLSALYDEIVVNLKAHNKLVAYREDAPANDKVLAVVPGGRGGHGARGRGRGRGNHTSSGQGRSNAATAIVNPFEDVECFECGHRGHIARYCPESKGESKPGRGKGRGRGPRRGGNRNDKQTEDTIATVRDVWFDTALPLRTDSMAPKTDGAEPWLWDSGASRHVCYDRSLFKTMKRQEGHVKSVFGPAVQYEHVGEVEFLVNLPQGQKRTVTLQDVIFLPTANYNLLSTTAAKMKNKGAMSIDVEGKECIVSRGYSRHSPLMRARQHGRTIYLDRQPVVRSQPVKSQPAQNRGEGKTSKVVSNKADVVSHRNANTTTHQVVTATEGARRPEVAAAIVEMPCETHRTEGGVSTTIPKRKKGKGKRPCRAKRAKAAKAAGPKPTKRRRRRADDGQRTSARRRADGTDRAESREKRQSASDQAKPDTEGGKARDGAQGQKGSSRRLDAAGPHRPEGEVIPVEADEASGAGKKGDRAKEGAESV